MKRRLALLDRDTAETAARIVDARPDWPCQRGCDTCCRNLAAPLPLARAEWERIAAELSAPQRAAIVARLAEPRVCPLLDRESGACTVYAVRPVACRAYGFYVARDGGRWCSLVEDAPELTDSVTLGNHERLEQALAALGEQRTLAEWLQNDRSRFSSISRTT